MLVIGLDPGLDGALSVVRGSDLLLTLDLPSESIGGTGTVKRRLAAAAFAEQLRGLRRTYLGEDWIAVVERVSAGSGQGVASVFSFGDTAGAIRGVLQALGFRIEYVTPAQWKRAMKCGKDKAEARTIAMARWPREAERFVRAKDHNRAESALIAAWGWSEFA